jgi:hypothetical protein
VVKGLGRDIRCPFEASRGHELRSQEEQRIAGSRYCLVGLEGFEVKRVVEVADRLDLEVELVARAGCCPR